jgi:hypothetical protein
MEIPLSRHRFGDRMRARLDKALTENAVDLAPGLSEAEIEEITAPLRGELHYVLPWLYAWHNGAAGPGHLLSTYLEWPPLEDAVAALLAQRDQELQGMTTPADEYEQEVLDDVNAMWPLHQLWVFSIPLMQGRAVVDLSVPNPQAPLWFHAPGHPQHGTLIAPSLAHALDALCTALETKTEQWVPERGGWTNLRSVNEPDYFGF